MLMRDKDDRGGVFCLSFSAEYFLLSIFYGFISLLSDVFTPRRSMPASSLRWH